MNYECPYCGKKCQNPQALQMHIKWKHKDKETKSETSKSKEVTKPLDDNAHQDGSEMDGTEPSEELEIEEAEDDDYRCPQCNSKVEAYKDCSNCGTEIVWGEE